MVYYVQLILVNKIDNDYITNLITIVALAVGQLVLGITSLLYNRETQFTIP